MLGGDQEIAIISQFVTVEQLFYFLFPGYGYVAVVFSRDMFDISINISKRLLVSE